MVLHTEFSSKKIQNTKHSHRNKITSVDIFIKDDDGGEYAAEIRSCIRIAKDWFQKINNGLRERKYFVRKKKKSAVPLSYLFSSTWKFSTVEEET